ncbi:MAG: pirin family protein [Taibaiella sp.]|nr:pirin family protein [Taibaiella sp.]
MAKTIFHPANERGHANHGWLDAHHSFSFANWYDPSKVHFGALRVLNDDIVKGGTGFGKHPHDNMEIITIILDGTLAHKDSMGHEQTIVPGEVQVMSAGSGVVHSEYNHDPHNSVNLLQTWIFPNKRGVTPRYDQRAFDEAGRKNQLQMLVSPIDNDDEGLKIHQDAWIYRTNLDAGHSVTHKLHEGRQGAYIFVISGQVEIDGKTLNKRDAIGISDVEAYDIKASADSDVIIFEVPMVA